ncbi:hypothetical protein [Nocardia stercoris]|uniref:hypothetical protein n=1 Tax=Nocardia stercoris TaxID=2483361 RepID=UPI001F2C1CCC|nr:hypothetical protein [Nocardia stercoris]
MAQPIGLDLIAPERFAPVLARLALLALGLGAGTGLLLAVIVAWPVAVVSGVVLGAPTALYALAVARRRLWLTATVLHARTLWRHRRLDLAQASGAEMLVYPGRLSRVAVRVTVGGDAQIVPVALYTDAGSGREMHLLGLRRLADALAAAPLPTALAVSGVLVAQIQAEIADADLEHRPLYRATRSVRARYSVQPVVLAAAEIAALG